MAVVIPAYNEEAVIGRTVARVREVSVDWRIVVIDDGSEDRTAEEAERAGAEVIRHPYNRGNGASIKTALDRIEAPVLAVVDADGQLPPESLPEMIKRLAHADMVVGARSKDSERNLVRDIGNWVLKRVASYVSGHRITDLTCGLRVFYRERCREFVHLYPTRFSFPATSTLALLTSGYHVEFYSIEARRRPANTTSKVKPINDGLQFLAIIFRIVLLFQPWRFFVPASLICFLIGLSHQIFVMMVYWPKGQLVMSGTFIIMSISALFLFCFALLAQQIAEIRLHLAHANRTKQD